MKIVLYLAILLSSAVWADEAADRTAVEATVAALNTAPVSPAIFTTDFPNAAELKRLRDTIGLPAGTLIISREPMGEATWIPALSRTLPRFVTRSVTFIAPDTAIVVATYERQSVVLVVRNEISHWRIASFRMLPEAQTKDVL